MDEPWREVGPGVFTRRHQLADLNVGLIVGDEACVIVDTRLSHEQARDLAAAVRRVTALPWLVVNTHGHYDHCFGNAVFLPAEIWGHERAVSMVEAHGEIKREYFRLAAARAGDAAFAAELGAVEITPPNRTLRWEQTLAIGGRDVRLHHLGLGHTDNDIVVEVPDAEVVFAGDLVEEGAPPVFSDAFPLDWPSTLDRLAAAATGVVVPGHGDLVDAAFVSEQAALLAAVAVGARTAFHQGIAAAEASGLVPLPAAIGQVAIDRAYRQLRGDPPLETPDELRRRLGRTAG